jgi:hypothetical protein
VTLNTFKVLTTRNPNHYIVVPCPQSSDTVFRNPNKNRGWPAALIKKDNKIRETDKITACKYTNRDPNKQAVIFVRSCSELLKSFSIIQN